MSHLALRNTKRGKGTSSEGSKFGSELVEILRILYIILFHCYTWIKRSFVSLYHVNYYGPWENDNYSAPISTVSSEEEFTDDEQPGPYVVAKGVGLMAAYTGRRAVFAVYPPCPEGLVVRSRGPAQLEFEFRKRRGLFLVGYVPPSAGTYLLRVSRFGRKALGSPFAIRVEDPPPGYLGEFGAGLWHHRPSPPPVLSGIVDFVSEKMFLTEEGKLLRLKGGDMIPVRDTQRQVKKVVTQGRVKRQHERSQNDEKETFKNFESVPEEDIETMKKIENDIHNMKDEFDERNISKTIEKSDIDLNKNTMQNINEIDPTVSKRDIPKSVSAKKQVVARIENLLATVNNENKRKDQQDRYKYVSKALMKELSLSLKILNMLGSSQELSPPESSPDCETKREFVIPEIKVTEAKGSDPSTESGDGILSSGGYRVRRGGKSGWHWGDDAVVSGCDRPGVLRASRAASGALRRIGMSGLLGKGQELTGVRLLHTVYREDLNNSPKTSCQIDRRNEKNNINLCKDKVNGYFKDNTEHFRCENKFYDIKTKINNNRRKANKLSGSFRTLSLPDFNRIYSLSVQGLRKAKSCGDRSFRAMSNSSFSTTLKHIFEKEQIYRVSNAQKCNIKKQKIQNGGATLVRMTHYGSENEKRKIQSNKTVEQWRKFWEEMQLQQSEKEFGKECSLELSTGIVNRGKALFEPTSDTESCDSRKICIEPTKRSRSFDETARTQGIYSTNGLLSVEDPSESFTTPSPVSNKTAFQKAKELFEGQDDLKKRGSLSERFHVSSLSEDLHHGVTPERLGVPNRKSAVTCLGSVYQPDYPHAPISNRVVKDSNDNLLPWDFILQSDPSYV